MSKNVIPIIFKDPNILPIAKYLPNAPRPNMSSMLVIIFSNGSFLSSVFFSGVGELPVLSSLFCFAMSTSNLASLSLAFRKKASALLVDFPPFNLINQTRFCLATFKSRAKLGKETTPFANVFIILRKFGFSSVSGDSAVLSDRLRIFFFMELLNSSFILCCPCN